MSYISIELSFWRGRRSSGTGVLRNEQLLYNRNGVYVHTQPCLCVGKADIFRGATGEMDMHVLLILAYLMVQEARKEG